MQVVPKGRLSLPQAVHGGWFSGYWRLRNSHLWRSFWSTKYVWMCSSSPSPQSFLSLKQAHIWNYFGERGELRTWQKFKKGCEMQELNKNDSWGNFCVLGNIKLSTKVVCTEVWELVVTSFPNIFGNLPILPWINLGTLN